MKIGWNRGERAPNLLQRIMAYPCRDRRVGISWLDYAGGATECSTVARLLQLEHLLIAVFHLVPD